MNDDNEYKFGDVVTINCGRGEKYKGVVFGNKIGFENGKVYTIRDMISRMECGCCTIIKSE